MIRLEKIGGISDNILKVTPPEKLSADDFNQVAPQVDSFISGRGTLRILVDATHFKGWQNFAAFKKHVSFVFARQSHIERVAIVAGSFWHYIIAFFGHILVRPQVKIFSKGKETEAMAWVLTK